MDKNYQFYKNRNKDLCVTVPSREECMQYLLTGNYLSEYSSEEDREIVLYNLGITQKLDELRELLNEIDVPEEKAKGYFPSVQELGQNIPLPKVGDWAIVKKDNEICIAKCLSPGIWNLDIELFSLDTIDFEGLLDGKQDKLVNKQNIKTITLNGTEIPILGDGTIVINTGGGSGGGMSQDDIENMLNPLKATITASPSLVENDGTIKAITLNYTASKKNNVIPSLAKINSEVVNSSPHVVYANKTTTYNLYVEYGSEVATASTRVVFINPWYIGFGNENPSLNSLNKVVSESLTKTIYLANTVEGNYLWVIVSSGKIPTVSTDKGGTYVVELTQIKIKDNYTYYRSVLPVTISAINYYVS